MDRGRVVFADVIDQIMQPLKLSSRLRLISNEWAQEAEDILWRRTKCGLHMSPAEREQFADWMLRNV